MTTKKSTKKTSKKQSKDKSSIIKLFLPLVLAVAGGLGITLAITLPQGGKIEVTIDYSEETVNTGDEGDYEEEIPTVEEIDGGGQFKDSVTEIENLDRAAYYELGSIEEVDTSSPEAFKNSTLGRCIVANNYYGAQCVSLARAFWWSYAGYDVSTCGTGLAKGMMNCWDENARDKFKTIWSTDEIQEGTWIVLDGNRTGHICMALGKANGGYVTCLGENQGGQACEYGIGGAGTNIINISVKNFIGGYTPLDYIEPEPTPEPEPAPIVPDTGVSK